MDTIYTIGVYGFTEEEFFKKLINANTDTFVDIRKRRGLRGKMYSFANSSYLQSKLKHIGIKYLHYKNFAPSKEMMEVQKLDDLDKKVTKSQRKELGESYKGLYQEQVLNKIDLQGFLNKLNGVQSIVLFCVEQEPKACHRSLAASFISQKLGSEVKHITI